VQAMAVAKKIFGRRGEEGVGVKEFGEGEEVGGDIESAVGVSEYWEGFGRYWDERYIRCTVEKYVAGYIGIEVMGLMSAPFS
jgi:hypothetical protein